MVKNDMGCALRLANLYSAAGRYDMVRQSLGSTTYFFFHHVCSFWTNVLTRAHLCYSPCYLLFAKAHHQFQYVLDRAPRSPAALYGYALLHVRLAKWVEARQLLQQW